MPQNVMIGLNALFDGIRLFYTHKSWWKHALIPMLGALLIYFGLGAVVYWGILPEAREFFDRLCEGNSGAIATLVGVLRWTVYVMLWLLFSAIVIFTVSVVYEIFGCIFFDALVEKCEKDIYNLPILQRSTKIQILQAYQAFWYGVGTIWWHLVLFLAALFFPVVGWTVAIWILGYRLGVSYFFSVGFYHGLTVRENRAWAWHNRMAMTAFGAGAYVLLLVPFAAVFVLPCLVVGGTILYQDSTTNKKSLIS